MLVCLPCFKLLFVYLGGEISSLLRGMTKHLWPSGSMMAVLLTCKQKLFNLTFFNRNFNFLQCKTKADRSYLVLKYVAGFLWSENKSFYNFRRTEKTFLNIHISVMTWSANLHHICSQYVHTVECWNPNVRNPKCWNPNNRSFEQTC